MTTGTKVQRFYISCPLKYRPQAALLDNVPKAASSQGVNEGGAHLIHNV